MPDPRLYLDLALPVVKTVQECADHTITVVPFLQQYYDLPYNVVAHITDLHALRDIYLHTNPLMTALAFATFFVTPLVLLVSEVNRNYSQVDRLWSILPVIYNVHYAVWAHLNGLPTLQLNHVMAVSLIWGARLTFNYWRKGGYQVGSEDYRWNIVKDYIGPAGMFILNVTFIALGQNILLWLITTPTYVLLLTARITGNTLSTYDTFFGRAMLGVVVMEYVADQAQWNYHKAKEAFAKTAKVPAGYTREQIERGFNSTGIFAWSRHPNFAAEQSFWILLYQWSCLESNTILNWTGAGALGYLILFQASTWLTELITAGKYPEYVIYQRRVGKFLPSILTKSMDVKFTPKEKQLVKDAQAGKGVKKL
ncbi:hypothetical protein ACN47E_009057 [Coniothyrium glycines]